jgi:hypothetical protein
LTAKEYEGIKEQKSKSKSNKKLTSRLSLEIAVEHQINKELFILRV